MSCVLGNENLFFLMDTTVIAFAPEDVKRASDGLDMITSTIVFCARHVSARG